MALRRLAPIVLSAAVALLVAVVLYLAFGNLSQHKGRIEALVTDRLGRPFAIDGAFELKVPPSISVVAERVRLGNADWGSQPQKAALLCWNNVADDERISPAFRGVCADCGARLERPGERFP